MSNRKSTQNQVYICIVSQWFRKHLNLLYQLESNFVWNFYYVLGKILSNLPLLSQQALSYFTKKLSSKVTLARDNEQIFEIKFPSQAGILVNENWNGSRTDNGNAQWSLEPEMFNGQMQ